MKRGIVGLAMLSFLLISVNASAKLFGISIKYEKGTREWNATHTETRCVGKGVCQIEIGAEIPLAYQAGSGIGTLGNTENGSLALSFPVEILKDSYWRETLADGKLYIGKDLELNSEIRSRIKNCPSVIRAGSYSYRIEGNSALVIF